MKKESNNGGKQTNSIFFGKQTKWILFFSKLNRDKIEKKLWHFEDNPVSTGGGKPWKKSRKSDTTFRWSFDVFKFANVGKFFTAIKNDDVDSFPDFIQELGFNVVNLNGLTPLFYATALGKINSVDIFISYEEMDINQKNLKGQNAAAIACQENQLEVHCTSLTAYTIFFYPKIKIISHFVINFSRIFCSNWAS